MLYVFTLVVLRYLAFVPIFSSLAVLYVFYILACVLASVGHLRILCSVLFVLCSLLFVHIRIYSFYLISDSVTLIRMFLWLRVCAIFVIYTFGIVLLHCICSKLLCIHLPACFVFFLISCMYIGFVLLLFLFLYFGLLWLFFLIVHICLVLVQLTR